MAKKHIFFSPQLVRRFPLLREGVWLLEAAIIRTLAGLIRALPPERAYAFADTLLRALTPVLQFATTIRKNLRIAFPHKDPREIEALTRAVCGNLGRAAVDLLMPRRIWDEHHEQVEFVMEDGIDFASYRDRPAVLVGGHIGAWQLGGFLAARYGVGITTIYAPEQNPYLQGFYLRSRAAMPIEFISRDGCMRGLSKALRAGRVIALTPDTRSDDGETIAFFGKPMRVSTSAARLALHNHCDLIPLHVERLGGCRFRVTLCEPIRPDDELAPAAEQELQMTATLFRHFEAWIRANPEQWMCFSRRWPREAYEG